MGLSGCKHSAYKSTNINQSNIMIINGVKTAMKQLPEVVATIEAIDYSERNNQQKADTIEYAIETLLQAYIQTHNRIHTGAGYSKAKQLLNELSEDL
jgi:endonuclease I